MLAGVRVLDVDRPDQVLGRLEAGFAGSELGQLLGRERAHDRRIEEEHAILPVVLRPVERAVDDPLEPLAVVGVLGEDADADADRDGVPVREARLAEPVAASC